MKPRLSTRHEAGLTLFEVGVVIAVVLILVAVLLPISHRPQTSAARKISCVNNLKQVGLAYRIWEGDNHDTFPMGIVLTNGGSMEMVATGNVVQSFLVMSNELSTPKILCCPADFKRDWAASFGGLANSNISYFVGADVTNDDPSAILSGDCNFEIGGKTVRPGLLLVWTNDAVLWATNRHIRAGNLGLGDGSVSTVASPSLRGFFERAGPATNRLAIP